MDYDIPGAVREKEVLSLTYVIAHRMRLLRGLALEYALLMLRANYTCSFICLVLSQCSRDLTDNVNVVSGGKKHCLALAYRGAAE